MSSDREFHNFGATKEKALHPKFQFKLFEDSLANVTLILKFVTVATFQGIYPQTVAYVL